MQTENLPDIISDEFQKCRNTTLIIFDGVAYSGGKLQAAKSQADTFSKARDMNVTIGLLAVALSVAAVACIVGGLYAWTELPTMMGWSEPAPPPVVSWYDSVVDSVVELWS